MVPECLAETGVGEIACEDLDPSRGEFGGQGFEPIEASGGREHPHAPVQDELADQFASQTRRGPGDQGITFVGHWSFVVSSELRVASSESIQAVFPSLDAPLDSPRGSLVRRVRDVWWFHFG